MKDDYLIFVVEDDRTTRALLDAMLGEDYAVECFASAEACLGRLAERLPDLFLLDVGLPDIDGHELCRRIKTGAGGAKVPVVFISGHDGLDEILAGYDAGGQDYIVKPFDIAGLHRKIENLRRIDLDRRLLESQAQASDELVNLMLGNLDEYAVLIKFLRSLNECANTAGIVESVQRMLAAFRLEGAVQIRLRHFEKTWSQSGENWPLEVAVMNHVRSLGRIFEFKRRSVYNFERITVLVTNMPLADAEACGRLRDHLAIAAESADAKLAALQSFADNAAMREEIGDLLKGIGAAVIDFGKRYDHARYQGAEFTQSFLDDLMAAFAHLGMSSRQEEEILELVRKRAEGLTEIFDFAEETQVSLERFSVRLGGILDLAGKTPASMERFDIRLGDAG